jgi:hypothetical protein
MNRKAAFASTVLLVMTSAIYVACGDDEVTNPNEGADGGHDGSSQFDSAGLDVSQNTDTGTVSDAGQDVQLRADTGNPITTITPGGDAASLNCGTSNCSLPTETCCLYPVLPGPPPFYGACSNGNSCPALKDAGVGDTGTATELQCEVAENCPSPGQVCCVQGPQSGSTGGKITSHCTAPGACVYQTTPILLDAGPDADAGDGGFTTSPRATLCDPAAADSGCQRVDSGACSGANIGTWNLPNGFGTCGGVAR